MRLLVLAWTFLAACDSPKSVAVDAPVVDIDAPAPDDAQPEEDAAVDASIDAPPSTSPRCTTTPTILLDVSPKVLGNIAGAGNFLYASAYTYSDSGPATDAVIITTDLTTGQQVGTPLTTARPVKLWSSSGVVFGADFAEDGTVWKLEPGQTPVRALEHVPFPGPAIIDAGYLYWTENAYNSTNGVIKRRPIAGGSAETVLACNDPVTLLVDGATIYCVGSQNISRGLKAGGSLPEYVSVPDTGYYFLSAILDGDSIYYIRMINRLYKQPLFGTAATTVQETTMIGSRYRGVAAATDVLYIVDGNWGIWRVDRGTYAAQKIVSSPSATNDPVLWNDHLYYQDDNPQLPFTNYVMHCVD